RIADEPSRCAHRQALRRPRQRSGLEAIAVAVAVAVGVGGGGGLGRTVRLARALFGEHLVVALGTDAVRELRVGALAQVRLDLAPVASGIAGLPAPGAERHAGR